MASTSEQLYQARRSNLEKEHWQVTDAFRQAFNRADLTHAEAMMANRSPRHSSHGAAQWTSQIDKAARCFNEATARIRSQLDQLELMKADRLVIIRIAAGQRPTAYHCADDPCGWVQHPWNFGERFEREVSNWLPPCRACVGWRAAARAS